MDKAIDLRSKCRRFRILVIGRANSGKTTLLKKVCNSVEDPEIRVASSGKKLDPTVVQESPERGLHDIDNELMFKSNPRFIFHDSCGFESGSKKELETVNSFINKRGISMDLASQLHVIWYCLPTDTNRPLLDADKIFFEKHGGKKIPVIAIFTKFDGLVTNAFIELREKQSIEEAQNRKFERAESTLNTNFIDPLKAMTCGPKDYVRLDDMRSDASNCLKLIETTAKALDDDTLKLLFVSVQQNSINLCIHYAIGLFIKEKEKDLVDIVGGCLEWFPHVWEVSVFAYLELNL